MSDLASELADLTARLVEIPSVSQGEGEIADFVERLLRRNPALDVRRVGNNLVATMPGYDPGSGVIVAGHLDTVPPFGPPGARRDGGTVAGLGAVDMKGGVAVMCRMALEPPTVPVRLVFYAAEEISRVHSGLLQLEAAAPELLSAGVAILMEPTGGIVEAGCQGTAKFKVRIRGRRAHTARPHMGVNAIHRAHRLLAWLDSAAVQEVEVEGCLYRPSLSAVSISGGVAGNVVPDEVEIQLNSRFAPTGDDEGSLAAVAESISAVLDGARGDAVLLTDWAPSAPPNLSNPVIARLIQRTGGVRAKLGWTDVAFFWERGIAACNFGPGDPELAHTDSEVVAEEDLAAAWLSLREVLHSVG
ncbi:MAG: succinyl-diaminopimelate desuccinylase [Actinomycetota bacterium]|nr:succinyl-diaminopimelate desuccinylase [Actinomycetota bacterium]